MSELKIYLDDNREDFLTLDNETIGETGEYFGFGWEGGYDFENLNVKFKLETFCNWTSEDFEFMKKWLSENAEIRFRAYIHKRDEIREQQERQEEENRKTRKEAQKEKKKDDPGFVYLIKSETGVYKIGRTKNVDNRVNYFGVKLPIKTELVYSFHSENYKDAELILHERYDDKRSHGEWFELDNNDVEEILTIGDDEL